MKKALALLAALLILVPGFVAAQTKTAVKSQAILVFADDDALLTMTDAKGTPLPSKDVAQGMVIPVGTIVNTNGTTAEIQLKPNGTIIKLSKQTKFQINALVDKTGAGASNDFTILGGKIRAVAAKLAGATDAPGYNFRTPTANCGVRGTDFAIKYDAANQMDWVCVQEGLVDFTQSQTGTTVPVGTNQFANTFDATFGATAVDASKLAEIFSDLDFVKLNPADVPSKKVEEVAKKADDANGAPADGTKTDAKSADPNADFLSKLFGIEVGSVTIDGNTYSKAVLAPVVTLDKFRLGLYLPIIYTRDMFDPSDWYHPRGNDEWSFGTDKANLTDKIADAATDLALKIKFLEWGVQGDDPFYLKVGNLQTMTLGHGTIVRNFANDQDFPSVRKIGLNAGAKLGGVTIEGLADDVTDPSVVGGRFAFDLIGDQVALGIQTVADLRTAQDQVHSADYYGDPILLVGGLDLQLFKLDLAGAFKAKAFADVNTISAYFREDATGTAGKKGFALDTIWHGSSLGSFGTEAGFMGNILIVNYRLSFQAERGLYKNALFQGSYYRTRSDILTSLGSYLADPSGSDKNLTMGIYGSAGFNLFGYVIFDGGYQWPFELKSDGSIGPSDSDYLKLTLEVPQGKIPFVNVGAKVSYIRSKFIPSIRDGVNLFDANTTFTGEGSYEIAKGMDLVVGLGTVTEYDSNGNPKLDSQGHQKVSPSLTLGTRVHF